MNGYGVFVWSSFVITFIVCAVVYFKTLKTLKKYEKEFAKEIEDLSIEKRKRVLENSKIASQVLSSLNNQFKAFNASEKSKKKSFFEISYATIIRIKKDIKEKKLMEKIIICDVQKEVYPDIEKALLNLLHTSGYPNIKFEKKVDFEELYNKKFN